MLTTLKTFLANILASTEIKALEERLATATAALDAAEKHVVAVAKDAAPEVQDLAATVLKDILSASDKIRTKVDGFTHTWEQDLYATYESGRNDLRAALGKAVVLLEKTKAFLVSKL
jgi:hypothetical protein